MQAKKTVAQGLGRTDDETVLWHVLASNLEPTSRSSTKIDTASCRLQKLELLVELNELEGGSSSVPLLPVKTCP